MKSKVESLTGFLGALLVFGTLLGIVVYYHSDSTHSSVNPASQAVTQTVSQQQLGTSGALAFGKIVISEKMGPVNPKSRITKSIIVADGPGS